MPRADAVIVGGGVIGSAIAYALAREGFGVVLVERDRIGAHASRAAAGMLAPLVEMAERPEVLAAGLRSLELYPGLVDEVRELSGIDPQLATSGVLRVAHTDEVDGMRAAAWKLAPFGCEWLELEQVQKREPRLGDGIVGALWSPLEGHVDPLLLTRALAAAAARRGASLALGEPVLGLLRDGPRVCGVRTASRELWAGDVILCTGAWTAEADEWSGVALPVEAVRGQMLALDSPQPPLETIVWGRGAYLVPRRTGTLLVGATVEHVGFDVRNTAGGIAELLTGAFELVPELARSSFHEVWAGLRPATPDRLPLVGPVPGRPGLSVATGHYRNGILLAPATAEWLVDGLLGRASAVPVGPFDPARFA